MINQKALLCHTRSRFTLSIIAKTMAIAIHKHKEKKHNLHRLLRHVCDFLNHLTCSLPKKIEDANLQSIFFSYMREGKANA